MSVSGRVALDTDLARQLENLFDGYPVWPDIRYFLAGYPVNESVNPIGYKKCRISGQPDIRYNPSRLPCILVEVEEGDACPPLRVHGGSTDHTEKKKIGVLGESKVLAYLSLTASRNMKYKKEQEAIFSLLTEENRDSVLDESDVLTYFLNCSSKENMQRLLTSPSKNYITYFIFIQFYKR